MHQILQQYFRTTYSVFQRAPIHLYGNIRKLERHLYMQRLLRMARSLRLIPTRPCVAAILHSHQATWVGAQPPTIQYYSAFAEGFQKHQVGLRPIPQSFWIASFIIHNQQYRSGIKTPNSQATHARIGTWWGWS
jgi:hypothetical protein